MEVNASIQSFWNIITTGSIIHAVNSTRLENENKGFEVHNDQERNKPSVKKKKFKVLNKQERRSENLKIMLEEGGFIAPNWQEKLWYSTKISLCFEAFLLTVQFIKLGFISPSQCLTHSFSYQHAVIKVPIYEELLYRFVIQKVAFAIFEEYIFPCLPKQLQYNFLKSSSARILVAHVIFAFAHYQISPMSQIFMRIPFPTYSIIYEITNFLPASIVAHSINNLVATWVEKTFLVCPK